MDIQLKRGLLDVCVLAVLRKRASYGYEIIKEVGKYAQISESTLYPILRRLESAGALTVREEAYNGRLRKYYAITEKGNERIRTFLAEWEEMIRLYRFISGEEGHE
ncbi:MAG: PadR family transcriptional regulator [Clostridia bacterium]|nr:PadR family transcriptional regulator [Clostridia bacterium]